MGLKIIACEVMKEELLAINAAEGIDYEFVSLGLHRYPEKLNVELQKLLDASTGYSRVILAFGLCGGGAKGLKASDFTLTIPKVHDCIALLLGSTEKFEQHRQQELGTLYLTCGWLNGDKSILSEYERFREKHGEKKATNIWKRIYDSYKRVLFISTGIANQADSLQRSHSVARLLDLDHHTTAGEPGFLEKIVKGPWDEADFIHVPPGGVIEESFFLQKKNHQQG
jgi:hypothetical protein